MELHLVLPGPLGARTGGTIYDRRVVEGLRDLGHAVHVLSLEGAFPRPSADARTAAARALEELPDGGLVLIDGLALGALPEEAAALGARAALVGLVHHPLCDEGDLGAREAEELRRSEGAALGAAAAVVTTSGFTAARLAELGLVPAGVPVHAVEPGVDQHLPPAPPWRGEGPIDLLSVGAVLPRKGYLDGLRALATLAAELPWRWRIVGRLDQHPSAARELAQAVKRAGLDARVELVGEVSDEQRDAELGAAHALLHPAHYEGYGMVVTEAVARGLPVITTSGGALGQTLPEGAGAAVPPGDADALAAALRALFGDPTGYPLARARALSAREELRFWVDTALDLARVLAAVRD